METHTVQREIENKSHTLMYINFNGISERDIVYVFHNECITNVMNIEIPFDFFIIILQLQCIKINIFSCPAN